MVHMFSLPMQLQCCGSSGKGTNRLRADCPSLPPWIVVGSRLTSRLVGLCEAPSWHGSSNELGLSCKTTANREPTKSRKGVARLIIKDALVTVAAVQGRQPRTLCEAELFCSLALHGTNAAHLAAKCRASALKVKRHP